MFFDFNYLNWYYLYFQIYQDDLAAMTSDKKMESKGTQIHLPLISRGSRGEISDKVTFSQVKSPPEQLNNIQVLG